MVVAVGGTSPLAYGHGHRQCGLKKLHSLEWIGFRKYLKKCCVLCYYTYMYILHTYVHTYIYGIGRESDEQKSPVSGHVAS